MFPEELADDLDRRVELLERRELGNRLLVGVGDVLVDVIGHGLRLRREPLDVRDDGLRIEVIADVSSEVL